MGNNSTKEVSVKKIGSIYRNDNDPIRPGYYKNKNKVMYQGEVINLLPGEISFDKLKYGYAKSNKQVYYKGKPILAADPKTFIVINRKNIKSITQIPEYIKLNSVLGVDHPNNTKRIYYQGTIIHTE